MRLSARVILNYANVNNFSYGNQWIVRSGDPNTVIVLFDSGKMVADGPSVDAVTEALTALSAQLKSGITKSE